MYVIIWKYKIKVEFREDFITYYSSAGKWAELFQKHQDFLGVEFAHVEEEEDTYITIDKWKSKESCVNFIAANSATYRELDRQCDQFTQHEQLIGKFTLPS